MADQSRQVAALDDQGANAEQIAKRLGITRHRVEWILDHLAEQAAPLTPRSDLAATIEPIRPDAVVQRPEPRPVGSQKPRASRAKPPRPTGETKPARQSAGPAPIKHGTPWGATRHRRAGEQPCEECAQASRDYQNARKAAKRTGTEKIGRKRAHPPSTAPASATTSTTGTTPPPATNAGPSKPRPRGNGRTRLAGRPVGERAKPVQCGTPAGYKKHRRNREPACQQCIDARREWSRGQYRIRQAAAGRTVNQPLAAVHGTTAGYKRHHKDGETPCAACADANRTYQRNYRARTTTPLGLPRRPVLSPDGQAAIGEQITEYAVHGGPNLYLAVSPTSAQRYLELGHDVVTRVVSRSPWQPVLGREVAS